MQLGKDIAAVVTGEVDLAFANMSDAVGQLAAGTVRPIGVTTATRSPYLPQVPTLMEQGIAGFSTESWNALLAPPGTPRPIVDKISAAQKEFAHRLAEPPGERRKHHARPRQRP